VQRPNITVISWDYVGFKNCSLFNQSVPSCSCSSDLTPRGRVVRLFDALNNTSCAGLIEFVPYCENSNRWSFSAPTPIIFSLDVSTGSLVSSDDWPLPSHYDKSLLFLIVVRPSNFRLNNECSPDLRTECWIAFQNRQMLHHSTPLTTSMRKKIGNCTKEQKGTSLLDRTTAR
jgi:hypothetical protein